jgi:hypothetical protein
MISCQKDTADCQCSLRLYFIVFREIIHASR